MCRRSRRQVSLKSSLCPLSVFGAGLEPLQGEAFQSERTDVLAPMTTPWRRWLEDHGWPEITEEYGARTSVGSGHGE